MKAPLRSVLRSLIALMALGLPGFLSAASSWRPLADARSINAVWMTSATHGVQVGKAGLVRRTTDGGTTWTTEAVGTSVDLHAVWGSDATHLWAVGDAGVIVFWNGTTWATQKSGVTRPLRGIFGTAVNNVFAVGDNGTVRRFNGTLWSTVINPTGEDLQGIWAANASNIWIVGSSGRILKWNGSSLATQTSGTAQTLRAVEGVDATNLWAVGDNGTILFSNGTTWAAQTSGTSTSLRGVAAVDATHVWATGSDGIVRFFDGISWASQFTTSPLQPLKGIFATSTTQAIAGGDVLTSLLWNGTLWTQSTSSTPAVSWNAVWGSEDSDMWVVGNGGNIMHWNGIAWTQTPSGSTADLLDVFGLDATHVYAVGTAGTILMWDGVVWSAMASGTSSTITSIWGSAPNQLYASRSDTYAMYFLGAGWVTDIPLIRPMNATWGFAGTSTDVFFAGEDGMIQHLFSNVYYEETDASGILADYHDVWGAAPDAVWAVGDSGVTSLTMVSSPLPYWRPLPRVTSENLRSVAGYDKNNVWTVGGSAVLKYSGTFQWVDDAPGKNVAGATGVWVTSPKAVFITTANGVVFVNSPIDVGELAVEQPAPTPLANKSTSVFGTVGTPIISSTPLTKTFTIKSLGANALTGLALTKTGTGAADFTVTALAAPTLAAGGSTTFDVTFTPSVDGARTATLTLLSNDADESPFIITLSGFGRVSPTITTQPVSKTVNPNAAVVFSVVAKGSATLGYQWQKFNTGTMMWDPVTGAANNLATLTLTPALEAKEGDYRVVITNSYGAATSNTATLTVNNPVLIIAPPLAPLARLTGQTASFTVNVDPTTTLPITYVWLRNGVAITGATVTNSASHTSTFTIPSVTVAHGGEISCLVKNIASSSGVLSNKVQLSVVDGAVKTYTLPTGGTALLTAATGGTGLTHVWKKGAGLVIPDANHIISLNKLTIKNLQLLDDEVYTCEVTGPGGTVVSGAFDLIVFDSAPALATGETSPLNMGTAIASGDYTYDIKPHLDPASNKTPTNYVCGNLPPGLKCNAATGVITGKPAVVLTVPKIYTVTMTITNAKGKLIPLPATTLTGTLTVNPLPPNLAGVYVGPIARNASTSLNSDRGGRLDLTVTTIGTYTGKITFGTATPLPFGGVLDTSTAGGGSVATETATIVRKLPLTNLTVTFTIDFANNVITSGSVFDGTNTANFTGWRNKWSTGVPATAYKGLHTFKLEGPGAGDPAAPQGYGYGSFTPTITTGATTVAGKLADGVGYATSSLLGPDGELLIYQASTTADCVLGTIKVAANANHTVSQVTLDWSRAPQAASATVYETGFGSVVTPPTALSATPIAGHPLVPLTAGGGLYIAPLLTAAPPSNILLNVTDDGVTNNARVNFSDAELGDIMKNPLPEPDITLRLSPTVKVNSITPAATITRSTTLSIPAATNGLFSGSFKLTDPRDAAVTTGALTVTRTALYYGAVVFEAGVPKGYGFFLLPKRPVTNTQTVLTTDQLSGRVVFEKFP